jgi:hypothetical protein
MIRSMDAARHEGVTGAPRLPRRGGGNRGRAGAVRIPMKNVIAALVRLAKALAELDARTALRPVAVPVRK